MTEPLTAAEDELRRFHWYQLAVELGQKEDFLALIAAERRDAVEEYKRRQEPRPEPECDCRYGSGPEFPKHESTCAWGRWHLITEYMRAVHA